MLALLFNGTGVLGLLQVGDKYKYPLDKVRVLWKLLENERDPKEPKEPIRPRFPKPKVCYRTDLPSDFRPLCDNPAAWMYLGRLGRPAACRLATVMSVYTPVYGS